MSELKICRRVMSHDKEEWCKIWRWFDLSFQNWHEGFDEFWPEHSKVSKICTLMGSFWPKCIMFKLKRYRRVMFDGTEGWCKIWRKTDLCFQKWHEKLGKFSQAENSDVILVSKMVDLNQNKNSRQLHRPDAVRILNFTLEINE